MALSAPFLRCERKTSRLRGNSRGAWGIVEAREQRPPMRSVSVPAPRCPFPAGFGVGQCPGRPFLGGRWWWLSPPLASAPPPRRPGGALRGQRSSATIVSAAPALGPTASLSPVRRIPRRCHSPIAARCPPFCLSAPDRPSSFPTPDTCWFGLGLGGLQSFLRSG